MNLQELIEKRKNKSERFKALNEDRTKRSLTEDEQKEVRSLMSELTELDTQIKEEEDIQKRMNIINTKSEPINKPSTVKVKHERYSLLKAIREFRSKGADGLTGIEKEMHERAIEDAEREHQTITGLGIPRCLLEERAVNVTGGTGQGVEAVQVNTQSLQDLIYPALFSDKLGAQKMTGLRDNQVIPIYTQGATASWEGEDDEVADSAAAFIKKEMKPHRLAVSIPITKQFLMQDSVGAEQAILRNINMAVKLKLEEAALYGTGSGDQPEGLFVNTDIPIHALGTNGASLDWKKVVGFETAIKANDFSADSARYVTNTKVAGSLKTIPKDQGSGIFLSDGKTLNGAPLITSNIVKSNQTKGTGSNLSDMIFGDFSKMIIASWGFLDLTIDDITLAKKATIQVTLNSFHDILCVRPKAFVKCRDIVTD